MQTPSLFDQHPARVVAYRPTAPYQRGSDTSRAGARMAQPSVGDQCKAYHELIQRHGRDGLTDAEASRLMDLPVTTINARRNELVRLLKVKKSPLRRDGGHGVRVTVWVASEYYTAPDAAH